MGQNKLLAFFIGLVVTGLVFAGIVMIAGKADKIEPSTSKQGIITDADLKNVKSKTEGLENFGNLPTIVTSNDIGRDNPFEPY